MVHSFNKDLQNVANEQFNIKNGDFFSEQIPNILTPVVPIVPYANVVKSAGIGSGGTSTTIYTTPTDRDFYLCSAWLSLAQDAGSAVTEHYIRAYVGGSQINILAKECIASTAQSDTITISFKFPIKIDRNTALTVEHGAASAVVNTLGGITGYISETLKTV